MTEASEASKSGKVPEAQAQRVVAGEGQLHKAERKLRLLVTCNQRQNINATLLFLHLAVVYALSYGTWLTPLSHTSAPNACA
jgi:hypothetical protein